MLHRVKKSNQRVLDLLRDDALHWVQMADGSIGRRPPRPRPKWPMAV